MAAELDVERVNDEERLLGGELVWWIVLLIISLPVVLYGLSQAPNTGGMLLICLGGILFGVSFAQVILRLPYLTHRLVASFIILIVIAAIFMGIAFLYSNTLDVPTPPPDTMYKAPVSGG
jgi:Na+/citrate or Na+/malate symporter